MPASVKRFPLIAQSPSNPLEQPAPPLPADVTLPPFSYTVNTPATPTAEEESAAAAAADAQTADAPVVGADPQVVTVSAPIGVVGAAQDHVGAP